MKNLQQRQQIANAWRQYFLEGKDGLPPETVMDSLIRESWQRSRRLNVDCLHQQKQPDDDAQRQTAIDANQQLIEAAQSYMNDLYRVIDQSNFMITLIETGGYVLKAIVNEKVGERSKIDLVNLSEARIGTNAIGTCLYLGQPVQTWAEEHCYQAMHLFTTSAAPIHGPDGRLLGCIAITGFADDVSLHTLGMSISIAYAIESKLHNPRDYHWEHTTSDPLVILNQEGCITSMNPAAVRFLKVTEKEAAHQPLADYLADPGEVNQLLSNTHDLKQHQTAFKIKQKLVQVTLSVTPLATMGQLNGFVIHIKPAASWKPDQSRPKDAPSNLFHLLVGNSPQLAETIRLAQVAARGGSNVLIMGESGTGKELIAQAIHHHGIRRNRPFVAVNCGALPMSLAESELFGYESGAYTGAKKEGAPGKFEQANGGTLFLDEIGEMPLALQVALLRVIQERQITRIGAVTSRPVDVMIIAATNKDLFQEVAQKNFRTDLFHRLNVFTLHLPPLRDRMEDLPLLAQHFIEKYNSLFTTNIKELSSDALAICVAYSWPGNVRELENVIERAVQIARDEIIRADDLPAHLQRHQGYHTQQPPAQGVLAVQEQQAIRAALKDNQGNIRQAALGLGISRATLYRKLNQYGISSGEYRR